MSAVQEPDWVTTGTEEDKELYASALLLGTGDINLPIVVQKKTRCAIYVQFKKGKPSYFSKEQYTKDNISSEFLVIFEIFPEFLTVCVHFVISSYLISYTQSTRLGHHRH